MDYDQYLKEVKKNLSLIEKLSDAATGVDERLDIMNKILLQIASQLVSIMSQIGAPVERVNPDTVITQQKLVTAAGTAEQLPPLLIPYDCSVVIKALVSNYQAVYIGTSKLDAEDHIKGFPLGPGESLEYKIKNLGIIWVDVDYSGEGVVWTVEQVKKEE